MDKPFIYQSRNAKGVEFRHRVSSDPKAGARFRQAMYKRFHEITILERAAI